MEVYLSDFSREQCSEIFWAYYYNVISSVCTARGRHSRSQISISSQVRSRIR